MEETITIGIGQMGVHTVQRFWSLMCTEHGIKYDGTMPILEDRSHSIFFHELSNGKCIPRTIFVDSEEMVCQEVQKTKLKSMFDSDNFVYGKKGAANCYALGRYGKDFINLEKETLEKYRYHVENCECVQNNYIFNSTGGGTGSAITCNLINDIDQKYSKVLQLNMCLFPGRLLYNSPVEVYNTIFNIHGTFEASTRVCLDNQALYYQVPEHYKNPTYAHVNDIINQMVSGLTHCRFEGDCTINMNQIVTNLVPFPQLNQLIPGYAPQNMKMGPTDFSRSVKELTGQVFASAGNFISFDTLRGNFMAICLLYRGDVCPKDMIDAVLHVKNHYKPKIVEWAPCAFKLGCNRQEPVYDEECIYEPTSRMVTRLVNNTIVFEQLENFCSTFDHMYAFRSFVHWYNRFGMEEDEFTEARTHIEKLIREYKTIHILGE